MAPLDRHPRPRRAPPSGELLAAIAAVNEAGTETFRLMSPLMPGEARDLQETQRAVNRLRGREAMVHAAVTQILLDWYATATGQTLALVAVQRALGKTRRSSTDA